MPNIVQLTPPGRGAIATILVEGPGALDAVAVHFRPASGVELQPGPADRPVFGHFGPEPGEETIVHVRAHDSVEIHCHGGYAAVARITELLSRSGCTAIDWRQWARRHHEDPITAEARIALASARTERTAMVLLDQFHGSLRQALDAIRQQLREGDWWAAGDAIEALLARASLGQHLVQPWRVVLAGPPNAGKSSLINALVGYQRAIVHPIPGTTRDVLTATTAVDGWPVEFSDTAGLRRSEHPIEQAGVALAHETLAAADLVLLVFDGSQPWSAENEALLTIRSDSVLLHNKSDLPPVHEPPRPAGLCTSARTGDGIDALLRTISDRLVPDPPPPGAAVPFTPAQVDALLAAQLALSCQDAGRAVEMLSL